MEKAFQIAMLVLVPLIWGLGADYIFERIRRKGSAPEDKHTEPLNHE